MHRRQTSAPSYRRLSFKKGQHENGFYRRIDRTMKWRILYAMEVRERQSRQPGKRNGILGHVAIEIMRYMLNVIDQRTGRLDPAITTIMKKIRRSKDAVVAALQRLKALGYLKWIRRVEQRETDDGPVIMQATNAYQIAAPKERPLPDCEAGHRKDRAEQELEYMAQDNPALIRAMARLAAMKRESAEREERNTISFLSLMA